MSRKSILLVLFSVLVGLITPTNSAEVKLFTAATSMFLIIWVYAYTPMYIRKTSVFIAPIIEKAVHFYGNGEYIIVHKDYVHKTVVKEVYKDGKQDVVLFELIERLYKVNARLQLRANGGTGMTILYENKQVGAITIDPTTGKLTALKIENNKPVQCDVAKLVSYVEYTHSIVSQFVQQQP